jgi:C-terminal processing protease CtpA/Prc
MPTRITLVVALALLLQGCGRAAADEDYETALAFESPELAGWSGGPPETLFADSLLVHSGRGAGRIERSAESAGQFSTFTMSLPVTFSGETLELKGWLRTEGVVGFAGLWLREDGPAGSVQFDNMQRRSLSGSTDWTEYRIPLPLDERARTVFLGALLVGEGTVWVDDLELLVDGVPASEAPALERVLSGVELDTEFDEGSGIEARDLTPTQVENVALLGRVWGFAKYHHPRIASGEVNWDYDLFRVLPSVLDAPDRASACGIMSSWLADLGDPDECDPCAELPAEPYLMPDIDWIRDRGLLGDALSNRLELIYDRRPADGENYFVKLMPNVGNPDFSAEAVRPNQSLPDAGFRLLALYRLWNIVEYWFPYRDMIGEDWDRVLTEFVPRVMAADTVDGYRLTMIALSARINDSHANVWAYQYLQPPGGALELPVILRFVEGKPVVTGYSHAVLGPATGLEIGDVIEEVDGQPVGSLVQAWRPYYPSSNEASLLRDIARKLTRGSADSVRIAGRRPSGAFALTAERAPIADLDLMACRVHDLPGETFRLLSDDVAYLKLSSVAEADVGDYIARALGADVLVVDIRNYPSEFVVFALGGRLVSGPTDFARFTVGDVSNPGAFTWRPPVALEPLEPRFPGAVVILVDEVSMSQAEYTALALRSGPNSVVVGSTTAGADGNVSAIPLPGGISSMISGIGVFYPDGTPTQRIGVAPDLEIGPTIAGVRAGRDEVLEAGVSFVLGREFRLPDGTGTARKE